MSGEQRLGVLPRSRKWQAIADMVERGAGVAAIAGAILRAYDGLVEASVRHPAVVRPFAAIEGMVRAARAGDEAAVLKHAAWTGKDPPCVDQFVVAFGQWLDGRWRDDPKKTDMVEYAYNAAVAALTIGTWAPGTTDGGPLAAALARLAEPGAFGRIAAAFFARIARAPLADILARAVAAAAGRDHGNAVAYYIRGEMLQDELMTHCDATARAIAPFAENLLPSEQRSSGEMAPIFVAYAVEKLCGDLRDAGLNGG